MTMSNVADVACRYEPTDDCHPTLQFSFGFTTHNVSAVVQSHCSQQHLAAAFDKSSNKPPVHYLVNTRHVLNIVKQILPSGVGGDQNRA